MIVILLALGYLAYTGVQESKSYYVTIKELHGMGDGAYTKRLRVAGNVQPGSIRRSGTNMNFVLVENDQVLNVVYNGTEPPPDTFKDNARGPAALLVAQRWPQSLRYLIQKRGAISLGQSLREWNRECLQPSTHAGRQRRGPGNQRDVVNLKSSACEPSTVIVNRREVPRNQRRRVSNAVFFECGAECDDNCGDTSVTTHFSSEAPTRLQRAAHALKDCVRIALHPVQSSIGKYSVKLAVEREVIGVDHTSVEATPAGGIDHVG